MPIGLGLFLKRQGIGAGGGGHAPEAEGCPVGAGHDDVHITAHRRYRATEGLGSNAAGLLAGGDKGVARRDVSQQSRNVSGGNHLQEGVGGIVAEAPDLACCVVECQAGIGAKRAYRSLVEPFLTWHAKVRLVPEVNQSHDAPEVVDPVGVIKRHAPAVRLGREAAQEQDAGARRKEGFEWVFFGVHGTAKISGISGIDKKVAAYYNTITDNTKFWQALPKSGEMRNLFPELNENEHETTACYDGLLLLGPLLLQGV